MEQPTEVAPGVFVATSSFATTTSTIVTGPASRGECLVIDPGVTVAETAALAGFLVGRGLRVAAGWSTHPHWDHLLWHRDLGDAPRYAAPAAVGNVELTLDDILADMRNDVPDRDASLIAQVEALDADSLPWDGPQAQLIVHDGHAPGHGAVFLPDSGILIAGDMCSDLEIPLLDTVADDPLGDYRTGLERLAAVPARLVIPGHGHVGDAAEFRRRLAADAAYLDALAGSGPVSDARLDDGPEWTKAAHLEHLRVVRS